MRLSSSGCVTGGQFVIDLSSAKKKGIEEGRREEEGREEGGEDGEQGIQL